MYSKRSIFLGAAVAACLSNCGLAVVRAVHAVVDFVERGWKLCAQILTAPAQVPTDAAHRASAVPLVAAKSFAARVDGRDTPRFEARWRMCPSV